MNGKPVFSDLRNFFNVELVEQSFIIIIMVKYKTGEGILWISDKFLHNKSLFIFKNVHS